MAVDAEQVAEVAKRRSRVAYLQEEVDKIPKRIEYLTATYARYVEELDRLLDEEDAREDRSAPIVTVAPVPDAPEQSKRATVPDTAVRDAAVRLGRFTLSELAAVLGVPKKLVKRVLPGLLERRVLRATGQRFHGEEMYEYVAPTEAGAAFEVQRRAQEERTRERRESERQRAHESGRGGDTHGGIPGTGNPMLDRLAKPVRVVIRRAERDGWALIERGDGHFALERDGYAPLRLSHTPRSATGEAASLESRLRNPKPLAERTPA